MVSTARLTTRPANTTRPPAGARTGIPSRAVRSSPRWPASQRCAGGSKPLRRSGSGSSGQPQGGKYRSPAPGNASREKPDIATDTAPDIPPDTAPDTAPGTAPGDAPAERSADGKSGSAAGREGSAAASSRAANSRINEVRILRVSTHCSSTTPGHHLAGELRDAGSGCGGEAVQAAAGRDGSAPGL